jgi:hypothetical protein
MAVKGIEKFTEYFKKYEDCYTIIGGAACDILMSSAKLDFRATKDIDMIVLFEDKFEDFAKEFWNFIMEGHYKCGWRNDTELHFYRFTDPDEGFPSQIELFSRKPDYHLQSGGTIIPMHIDNDTSSLSAIMLSDDFYYFMLQGREIVAGLPLLKPSYLIVFKMYAWVNLMYQKTEGKQIDSKEIRKHKNDVFRLWQLVSKNERVTLHGEPREAVIDFLRMVVVEDVRTEDIGIETSAAEIIDRLHTLYQV